MESAAPNPDNRCVLRLAGLIAAFALTSCAFVDAAREHLDPNRALASIANIQPTKWIDSLAQDAQTLVVDSSELARTATDQLGALPNAARQRSAGLTEVPSRIRLAFEPRASLRRILRAPHKLAERARLLRWAPKDASDPERDVSTFRPPPTLRRSLIGRVIDRIFSSDVAYE